MSNVMTNFRAEDMPNTKRVAFTETSKPKVSSRKSKAESGSQSQDPNAVPEGTAAEVMEWVGNDPSRAQQALDAENSKERPRTTLVDDLERVAQRDDAEGSEGNDESRPTA